MQKVALNLVGVSGSKELALDCCRELFDTTVQYECDTREESARCKLQVSVEVLTHNIMHTKGTNKCLGSYNLIKSKLWLMRIPFDLRPIEDYLATMGQVIEKG